MQELRLFVFSCFLASISHSFLASYIIAHLSGRAIFKSSILYDVYCHHRHGRAAGQAGSLSRALRSVVTMTEEGDKRQGSVQLLQYCMIHSNTIYYCNAAHTYYSHSIFPLHPNTGPVIIAMPGTASRALSEKKVGRIRAK